MHTRINSNIRYLQDTSLDTDKALRRKLSLNDINLCIDTNTIVRYIHFKAYEYNSSEVYFEDDIFERQDFKIIIKTLERLNINKVYLSVLPHNYTKFKSESLSTIFEPVLILPTFNSETYKNMGFDYDITGLYENLDYGQQVRIPVLPDNKDEVAEICSLLFSKLISPVLYTLNYSSSREHSMTKNTVSVLELENVIKSVIPRLTDEDTVIIENCPQCMFEGTAFPINLLFKTTYPDVNVLCIEGIKSYSEYIGSRYTKLPKCEKCDAVDSCAGVHLYYT